MLHAEGLDDQLAERLNIWSRQPDLSAWQRIVERFKKPARGAVKIGVVGKYVHLRDSYKSLHEALVHGGLAQRLPASTSSTSTPRRSSATGPKWRSRGLDAILVPGGFGDRGTEGKIAAIRYARENKIPFFGICLGMQLAVVEFARHVCGLKGANSTEFDKDTPHPVIDLMPEQRTTRRQGRARCASAPIPARSLPGTVAAEAYGATEISERHRHRYEFANDYRDGSKAAGLVLSGTSPDKHLVEMSSCPITRTSSAASSTPSSRAAHRAAPAVRALRPRRPRAAGAARQGAQGSGLRRIDQPFGQLN